MKYAYFDTAWRQEGEGLMVVLAVGVNTYQGKMEEKMKEDEDEKSVLQRKLDDMTNLITKVSPRARPLLPQWQPQLCRTAQNRTFKPANDVACCFPTPCLFHRASACICMEQWPCPWMCPGVMVEHKQAIAWKLLHSDEILCCRGGHTQEGLLFSSFW